MRHLASRSLLAVLTAFLAVSTMAGALFVVPTLPLEWLEGSVFNDYTIPAVALAFVGGLSIVALLSVAFRPAVAGAMAVVAGLAMVIFEVVEIWVVGLSLVEYGAGEPVAWLQVVFIAIGLITAAVGLVVRRSTVADPERSARSAVSSTT